MYYTIDLVILMKIGNILKYKIKVLDKNDNIIYEGMSDDADSNIKDMEYTEVVELNPDEMIIKV